MPSIYYCQFMGNDWSEWEKSTILEDLPDEFLNEKVVILIASGIDNEQFYLYDPEKEALTWSKWGDKDELEWAPPSSLQPPPNWALNEDDSYFSISNNAEGEWIISINMADETIYWKELGTDDDWDGPSYLDVPPNFDDSTDIFVASDNDSEWVVAINLEDKSTYYAESDGEDYSEWEQVPELEIPEEWLEFGLDLDGAIFNEQLQVYAIVYDDNVDEEEDETDLFDEFGEEPEA